MLPFDPNAYFAAKAAQGSATDKFAALEAASAEKTKALEEHRLLSQQRAAQKATEQGAVDASWSGQLGLESGGFLGNRVNEVASLASGTSRLAGQIASLAPNAMSYADTLATTQADTDAWNRLKAGKSLPEDEALLNRPIGPSSTVLKSFQDAEANRATGRKINEFFDLEKIVDPTNRSALTGDLKKGFDAPWAQLSTGVSDIGEGNVLGGTANAVSGLAKLLFNTGNAVLSNPTGVKEYVIENIPQLFVGALGAAGKAGMAASNVGYAADTYQKGIENYAKENNGALPSEAERQTMALKAASLALAEQAGDVVGLGAAKLGKQAIEGSAEALKSSFKESLKNVAKAAAKGTAAEAPTEGFQTYMEGDITGKPASASDIYTGAVIGGVSGGVLSGGGRAVSEVANYTPEKQKETQQEASQKEALQAAVQSGDVTAYVDPTKGSYAPDKAVAALYGNSQLPDATPETKQTNYEQAVSVVDDLEARKAAIASIIEEEAALEAEGKKSSKKVYEAQLSKLERQSIAAEESLNAFKMQMQPAVEEDAATIEAARKGDVDAVDRMINLSMAVPERLDAKVASELADAPDSTLSESQRTYLRAFSEARIAENALKGVGGVSEEIFVGSAKNVGIAQYRSRMADALLTGNQKVADRQIKDLGNFVADHQVKAQLAQQALQEVQQTGKPVQLLSTGNGGWEIKRDGLLPRKEVSANGGMTIHKGTPEALITNIGKEANALSKASAELEAAYAMKFAKAVPAVEATTPSVTTPPAPATAPSGKLLESLDKQMEYLTNPPADYTTAKGQKIAAWAQTQLDRVEAAMQTTPKDSDMYESLADARSAARRLVAKAKLVVEGDESLKDFESTVSPTEETVQATTAPEAEAVSQENLPVDTPTQTVEPTVPESGVLNALTQKSPEGTLYQSRNLMADYFTQSAGDETAAAKRPLVEVKDFMKALANKTVRISDFLQEKDRNLSDSQKDFIRLFNGKVREWSPVIQRNLIKGYWNNTEKKVAANTGFEYRDLMQSLIQGTTDTGLDLEENVKTALVYGAMRAIVDTAEDGEFNTPQTINRMMQRDDDSVVSDIENRLLGNAGLRENLWRNSAGQAAVAALGFKPNDDAPADLLPRLESTFGAHIEKLLMDVDVLQRTTLTMAEMEQLIPLDTRAEGEKVVPWKMLKLARNSQGDLNQQANEIAAASKGTKNILDKLFGVVSKLNFPSLTPLPFKQVKAGGVDEGVPSLFVKVLNEKQSEENFIRDDMWAVLSAIPEEDFLEMAGKIDPEGNVIHAAELLSTNAKNEGLAREYRNLKSFANDTLLSAGDLLGDVPFFMSFQVWQQQRVGIANNGFNPQSSKMHRAMYYKKDWKQAVSLTDVAAMNNFKLRVAESFGVKTDAESSDATLAAFEGMVNPDKATSDKGKAKATKLQAAIKVLQKAIYESVEPSIEDIDALKAGVKAGGEKLQSMAALMDMAHMYQAQQSGADSFTTHLQGEVDGKTNGIILSQLLFGGAESIEDMKTRMRRGGIYFEEDGQTQFNLWKSSTGSLDQYESLTQRIVRIAKNLVYTAPTVFAAIETFTKPLELEGRIEKAGRDLTKNPLTTLMFGAKLYSAVDKMADKVIDDIYKRIVEIKNGDSQLSIKDLIGSLNTLLSAGKGQTVPMDTSVDNALRIRFTTEQTKAIKKAFHMTLGTAAKQAISEDFNAYLNSRAVLDKAAKTVFDLSNAMISSMREDYIQELIAADQLPTRNGVPIRALSRKEDRVFKARTKNLLPLVHTVGSLRDGDLSKGISLASSETVLSTDPVFQSNAAFGTPFKDTVGLKDKTGKSREAYRVSLNSTQRVQKAPRTGPAAKLVHSLDSATSHDAQLGRQAQNNHDALVSGLAGFSATAEALNKSLFNNLVAYSPLTEILNSLTGLIERINAEALASDNKELSEQAKQSLADTFNEYGVDGKSPIEGITAFIKELANAAYQADKMKLQVLADTASVDQYTLEGGNYQPTQADKQAIQEKLNNLSPEVRVETYEALDSLASMLKGSIKESKQTVTKTVGMNSFGALGKPQMASDKDFVAELEKRKQLSLNQMVFMMKKRFAPNTVNREILEKIVPLINPELKMVYVEKDTPVLDAASMPTSASRGWYVATKDGVETIYVLGTSYQDSGITPELFLHELLHAALAKTIRNPNKQANELVAELGLLKDKALEVINADPALSYLAPAVTSVDELVSWGMTNQDFQVKVLSKVEMPSKTKGNTLVSGMKAFVERIAAFLFRNPTAKQNNGLMVLVQNVSGLVAATTPQPTGESINLSMEAVNSIDEFTTHDILNALNTPEVDAPFREHLANLLGGIVEKLHGPYGTFKDTVAKSAANTPMDTWLKALDTGKVPFGSKALVSGFKITQQEAFVLEQVEATMRAALDNGALTKVAYRELSDLYTEVQSKLSVESFFDGDWSQATPDERTEAKALYDFVFKIEKNNGDKSDYLARFAALGLAHQGFHKLLQMPTNQTVRSLKQAKGFADRIQVLFEKVLAYFNGMVTGTYAGQPADSKLTTLVNNLVDIEAKKRHTLKSEASAFNYMQPIEKGARALTEEARKKIGAIAGSKLVRTSSSGLVRGAGALARTVVGDRVEIYLEGLARLRNAEFKGRQGVVAGLLNDVRGPKDVFNALLRETKNHERIRKNIITDTGKVALQEFANAGKDLTIKDKAAISAVFLRTGAHVLASKMSLTEIEQLLSNSAALKKAITATEAQLVGVDKFKPYFIKQANALAYYKATGKVKSAMLMMNAHNIAKLYGTSYTSRITEQQANAVEPVINELTTLYALEYIGTTQLAQAANVLRTENQRTDGNGVEFVLKLHQQLEEESAKRLFDGRKTLMMKGYTPEIFNPHTAIQVATEEEGVELVKLGYVRGSTVEKDSADPDTSTRHFYVLKDGGLQPHLTGIISYDAKKAKGTKKHNGYTNISTDVGLSNAGMQLNIINNKQADIKQLFNGVPRQDLSKQAGVHMAPVLNDSGDVVNWRYLMAESTKNTLLERDNRFEKVLGAIAGSIYSKETTQEQNAKVVGALKADYDSNYASNMDAYVLIGPKSTDAEFREIWNLLPEDTKTEVRNVWGFDGLYVRSDSLDITFGYRKLSLSQVFDKDPEARNALEKVFAATIQWNLMLYARVKLGMNQQDAEDYSQRAGVVVARGERIWQEIVRETKDIIVVKSGLVMVGNITSNLSLLAVAGVPMKDILKSHLVAMKGATGYQADTEELNRYKMLLETGYSKGNTDEIQRNILRLEDSLARNPVKGLIDAGLMPTIVEDVAADDDLYSYKSAFVRKTDRFTKKLNSKVVEAGKFVYMSQDSKAYQLLSRTTQLSDFVARYTLYQHLTTRKENPLSHDAAIQEASDAFVNYDIPMHRGLQYTDDMGITMFTKYFVRIQRVLLKMGRENPARVLLLALMNNYMDLLPNVLDSAAVSRIGNNPFNTGALQFPDSLGELSTVSGAMSLLK